MKIPFKRARDIWRVILENRMVTRMKTQERPLADEETLTALHY